MWWYQTERFFQSCVPQGETVQWQVYPFKCYARSTYGPIQIELVVSNNWNFHTFEAFNRRIKLAGKNFRVFWSEKSWKTWFASVFCCDKFIEILVTENQGPVRVTRLSELPWWGNFSYISLQNTEKTVKNKNTQIITLPTKAAKLKLNVSQFLLTRKDCLFLRL